MTMPSVCDNDTDCPTFLGWLELVAVIIFTMEYACRIYAAPEAYPVRSIFIPYSMLVNRRGNATVDQKRSIGSLDCIEIGVRMCPARDEITSRGRISVCSMVYRDSVPLT